MKGLWLVPHGWILWTNTPQVPLRWPLQSGKSGHSVLFVSRTVDSNPRVQYYMDKSKDGNFQVCRFEMRVRTSHPSLNPRFRLTTLHRESLVKVLSPRDEFDLPQSNRDIQHVYVTPDVPCSNEQTMEYAK